MSISPATHQVGATAITSLGSYISLHTGVAGTTGANEASGSPYVRVQSTPYTADGIGDTNSPQVNIPCPAGTYYEGGVYSTPTGGTLAVPSGLAVVTHAGGTLTTGVAVFYKLTAFNWSGETTASTEVSFTPSGGNLSGTLSWSTLVGVSDQTFIAALLAGFKLYRGTSAGAENVLVATIANTATSYIDTGAAGTTAAIPGSNTASTFVGSAALVGGPQTVTGPGATSINVAPGWGA